MKYQFFNLHLIYIIFYKNYNELLSDELKNESNGIEHRLQIIFQG
jgi:hypothetical protein